MIHAFFLSNNNDNLFDQAEELFDAASRYLLFPLKRAVADALLPHLEMVPPAELCHWLILSDMYVFLALLSLLILQVAILCYIGVDSANQCIISPQTAHEILLKSEPKHPEITSTSFDISIMSVFVTPDGSGGDVI